MNAAPTTYAIRMDRHLDDHWSGWLGEPDLTRESDGTATITSRIADEAQLHDVLASLHSDDVSRPVRDVASANRERIGVVRSADRSLSHLRVGLELPGIWPDRSLCVRDEVWLASPS
jgi:hypothetical protein